MRFAWYERRPTAAKSLDIII